MLMLSCACVFLQLVERGFELIRRAGCPEAILAFRRQLDLAPAAPEQRYLQVILES
jgi:hypothetical protein